MGATATIFMWQIKRWMADIERLTTHRVVFSWARAVMTIGFTIAVASVPALIAFYSAKPRPAQWSGTLYVVATAVGVALGTIGLVFFWRMRPEGEDDVRAITADMRRTCNLDSEGR